MEAPGNGNNMAQSADKSLSDNQGTAIRPCACGAICWQCCGPGPGLAEAGLVDQSGIQLSDSTLQLRLTEYASMQSGHSGGNSNIRTLRSWSSSDKHGPHLEDQGKGGRGPRRFSVAGPAGSTAGSRQSQKHLSLHTWAEEDELPDTSGGPHHNPAAAMGASVMASRNAVLAGQQIHAGRQAANHYRNLSHGNHQAGPRHFAPNSSSSSVSSGTGGGPFGKRMVPEATFGFLDVASSSSSSGPPSTQHTASAGGSHRRLRTPYSISIPSMIGSPLSFTQSFLASRSSMYGRQPPSSQIRAAHIDWDSLSMMEEWGNGVNRGDLPVWHQGMGQPIDLACGGGIARPNVAGQSQLNFQRAHLPAMGEAIPQHLQHIYQQHQLHYHHLQQQMLQQQMHHQRQEAARNSCVSGALHAHMAAAVTSEGLPGSLGDVCVSMAQAAVIGEWERQMAWDYACHHHPLLASFSVASPLKLSSFWRCALLAVIVIVTLCVLIGIPAALTALLGKQGSSLT